MRKIFLFGDSIATASGLPKKEGYFDIIEKNIQSRLPDRIIFFDLAVPGVTLQEISMFILEETSHRVIADSESFLVILAAGTNDILSGMRRGLAVHEISEGLCLYINDISNRLIAHGGKVLVLPIPPVAAKDGMVEIVKRINQDISDHISKHFSPSQCRFVNIPGLFPIEPSNLFLKDLVHLNKVGNSKIVEVLSSCVEAEIPGLIHTKKFLTNIYPGITTNTITEILGAFTQDYPKRVSPLFIGATDDKSGVHGADAILGGICIRPDIKLGISLNELFQAFMPMMLTKELGIPSCVVMIPDREEIFLKPASARQVLLHCDVLEAALVILAREADIHLRIVRTSNDAFQRELKRSFDGVDMDISTGDSLFISRLNSSRGNVKIHSEKRVLVTREFVKYHTRLFVRGVLGYDRTLLVEDLSQYRTYFAANRYVSNDGATRFAAFLPLPGIKGECAAFNTSALDKIIFPTRPNLSARVLEESSDDALFFYYEIGRLLQLLYGGKSMHLDQSSLKNMFKKLNSISRSINSKRQ